LNALNVTQIILHPLSALSLDEGLNALNGKNQSAAIRTNFHVRRTCYKNTFLRHFRRNSNSIEKKEINCISKEENAYQACIMIIYLSNILKPTDSLVLNKSKVYIALEDFFSCAVHLCCP
jgi:hypothetical protein